MVRDVFPSKTNALGYRGIKPSRTNRYVAHIGSSHIYLGSFNTPEEAARAYDKAAKELYGDKAILNFPNEGLHDNQTNEV